MLPDKAVPQIYKIGIPTMIFGIDPRTDRPFVDHSTEVYAGWCNAAKGMDAWGAQAASFGNLWKATAEINESLFPHIQWERDYRTDSGGPGQWRGLCGSHYVKEVRVPAKVYTYVVGMKYPMPGIAGGKPGAPNQLVIRANRDDRYVVEHTANWVPMEAGDTIVYDYGGGGGWGDPARPRPAGGARRRARRVRERRRRRARLRRRADRLARRPHARGRRRARPSSCGRRRRNGVSTPGFRVGIDVGGTFTDLICVTPDGEVLLDKTPDHARRPVDRRDERHRAARGCGRSSTRPSSARASRRSCTAPRPPTTP